MSTCPDCGMHISGKKMIRHREKRCKQLQYRKLRQKEYREYEKKQRAQELLHQKTVATELEDLEVETKVETNTETKTEEKTETIPEEKTEGENQNE